jgi:hypothetical protein
MREARSLIPDVEFEIVRIGVDQSPSPPPQFATRPVAEPDDQPGYEADAVAKDKLTASILQLDGIRALVNASICAGLLALDRERFADKVQKGFAEYPLFRLLARDSKMALDAIPLQR